MENPKDGGIEHRRNSSNGSRLKIKPGAFYHPKYKGGEDAYFFDVDAQVIGVADGVGSWSRKGIDAGEYARQLMENAAEAVKGRLPNEVNPMEVLAKAHRATAAEGSSTACIICFDGHLLRSANLGDSGFLVWRRRRVVYKSRPQQHDFNHPYQMGRGCGDVPGVAEEGRVPLKGGDVIVAGTDGLWDNLWVEEINEMMLNNLEMVKPPEAMAKTVAVMALMLSRNKTRESPFQRDATKAGVHHYGGKRDDITVVVAYVVEDDVVAAGCGRISNFSGCENNIARLVCDEDGDTLMVDAY